MTKRPDLAERNRSHEHPIFPLGEDSDVKHCRNCCVDKKLEEFSRDRNSPDGRQARCKNCVSAYQKLYFQNTGRIKQRAKRQKRAADRHTQLEQLKNVPCADCGGRFPKVCMDFDHVRGEKVNSISRMIHMGYSWKEVIAETEKCEVVCSNCHRIRTAARGQWFVDETEGRVI